MTLDNIITHTQAAINDFPCDLTLWTKAPPMFPEHHFRGNGMELPFQPSQYVYSNPVMFNIKDKSEGILWAFYKRGVKKYRTMIQKGIVLPPIILIISEDPNGNIHGGVMDGNHRSVAAQEEGLTAIPCLVAVSLSLYEKLEYEHHHSSVKKRKL